MPLPQADNLKPDNLEALIATALQRTFVENEGSPELVARAIIIAIEAIVHAAAEHHLNFHEKLATVGKWPAQ